MLALYIWPLCLLAIYLDIFFYTFSFSLFLKTVFQDGGVPVLTDDVSLQVFIEQLKEQIVSSTY